MALKHVCFVSNEVYPVNKGGIGRWLYNTVVDGAGTGKFTVLLYGSNFHAPTESDREEVLEAFAGNAEVLYLSDIIVALNEDILIEKHSTFDGAGTESYLIYRALKHLVREESFCFDFIEFIDFGGPGFFTAQAKKGEAWLGDTQVVTRLHSTNSLIVEHEVFETNYSTWHSNLHDIERKTLQDSDLIISHIPAISDINRDFYDFPSEWYDKVVLNTPPVLLDKKVEAVWVEPEQNLQRLKFSFTARLAPFKRPDVFIDAAIKLLDSGVDASFLITTYGWDLNYIGRIKRKRPSRYEQKITFTSEMDEEDRLTALQDSVIVISSAYESFCFLAFECLQRGQAVILNKECAAFGRYEFWRDGYNCLMFDGTPSDLAEAMKRAEFWVPQSTDMPATTLGYWAMAPRIFATQSAPRSESLLVVTLGKSAVSNVLNELGSVFPANEQLNIEEGWSDGSSIRAKIANYDLVTFLSAGMVHEEEFLTFAKSSLDRNPETTGIVPQYRQLSGLYRFGLNGGDLVSCAVSDFSKVGIFGTIFRASLFGEREHWGNDGPEWLHLGISKAILAGKQLIASPAGHCVVFNGVADTVLSSEIASGIFKRNLPAYSKRFNATLSDTVFNNHMDEIAFYGDLKKKLWNAEQLAIERLSSMYEMEQLIVSRDEHIKADGVMLRERLDAMETLGQHIQMLTKSNTTGIWAKMARLLRLS